MNPVLITFIQGRESITYMILRSTDSAGGVCYEVRDTEGYFYTFMDAVAACGDQYNKYHLKR